MHDRSVLVVEDDENVRTLLAGVAGKHAPRVDLAIDGVAALELLKKHHYDVVLLDLMLPRINGVEVADSIAKMSPRPKVIVISAIARYFTDHFPQEVTVIQKPFDLHLLEDLIRKSLGTEAPASQQPTRSDR